MLKFVFKIFNITYTSASKYFKFRILCQKAAEVPVPEGKKYQNQALNFDFAFEFLEQVPYSHIELLN